MRKILLNVMAILGVAGLSLAWRSEGANLDAGGEDKTAKVPAAEIAKKKDDASALPIKPFLTLPCPDGAHCLAFSPDGRIIAVASAAPAGKIRFFETATGKPLKQSLSHAWQFGMPIKIAFSPDGSSLASVRAAAARCDMRLWRWETETELASLPDLVRMPPCFHPKLPLLAIAEIRKVVLFNLANKQVEEKIPVEVRVDSELAFSPDGSKFAVTTPLGLQIWKLPSGEVEKTFESKHGFNGIAWLKDGKSILSSPKSEFVNCWDLETGKSVQELPCRIGRGNVFYGSFSAGSDGKFVVKSATIQGFQLETQIWELASGRTVYFTDHGFAVFSPDAKLVATSWKFTAIALWRIEDIQAILK